MPRACASPQHMASNLTIPSWQRTSSAPPVCGTEGGATSSNEPPKSQAWKDKLWRWMGKKKELLAYIILFLLASVANSLYFKKMTNAMPNYGWFLTILSTWVYVPVFGILWVGVPWIQKKFFPSTLSDEDRQDKPIDAGKQCPISKFFIMGMCDSLSGVLMILGGIYTAGTTQMLLTQACIPVTMVMTIAYTKMVGSKAGVVSYHNLQYVGSFIVILGVVIVQIPKLLGWDKDDDGTQDVLVFNVIFLLSNLPASASSVFKQFSMQDYKVDSNQLQFYVASFQVLVNVLAMPIYTLSILGPQRVPLDQMPLQVTQGGSCLFFGESTITENCGGVDEKPCDDCVGAWYPVFYYMAINFSFNVLCVLVIKKGSAALSQMVACARIPLGTIAFCSPLIMGNQAAQLQVTDFLGLLVLLGGLVIYRYGGIANGKAQSGKKMVEIIAPDQKESDEYPLFSFGAVHEITCVRTAKKFIRPTARTVNDVRSSFYARISSPKGRDPRLSPLLASSPMMSPAYTPPRHSAESDVMPVFTLEGEDTDKV